MPAAPSSPLDTQVPSPLRNRGVQSPAPADAGPLLAPAFAVAILPLRCAHSRRRAAAVLGRRIAECPSDRMSPAARQWAPVLQWAAAPAASAHLRPQSP